MQQTENVALTPLFVLHVKVESYMALYIMLLSANWKNSIAEIAFTSSNISGIDLLIIKLRRIKVVTFV